MSWEIKLRNGIYLPQIDWHLDATKPVRRSFTSHAHFDHMGKHEEVLCTERTANLIKARLSGNRSWNIQEFETPFEIEQGVEASLFPAGHVPGSAMIRIVRDGESLLYTGDFKLADNPFDERCATPSTDILVMETTYGIPKYIFPSREEIIGNMVQFCRDTLSNGETPILFGYSLGKSQTILKSLAESELPVMLHEKSFQLTIKCQEAGLQFPEFKAFDLASYKGHVIISPPQSKDSEWLNRIQNRKTAMISGWAIDPSAVYRYQSDKAFPLSDHADYLELQEFVAKVNPKQIYTIHGFAEEFAATLRDMGYQALALGKENQLALEIHANEASPVEASETDFAESIAPPESQDAFHYFAEVAESISSTDSKERKLELIENYLETLGNEESLTAIQFLTGRPASRISSPALDIDLSLLKQAVFTATIKDDSHYRAAYQKIKHARKALSSLVEPPHRNSSFSLTDARHLCEGLAAALSPSFRVSFISEALKKVDSKEAFFLLSILKEDLDLGLSQEDLSKAIATRFGTDPEQTLLALLKCHDIKKVGKAAETGLMDAIRIQAFTPIRLPEPSTTSPPESLGTSDKELWYEELHDGIRCQIHKVEDHVEIYDAELQAITHQFPEIVESTRLVPQDFIADAVIVAWMDEQPLPLSTLEQRMNRKGEDLFLGEETPAIAWLSDLLWLAGNEATDLPFNRRRSFIERFTLTSTVRLNPVNSLTNWMEIESLVADAVCRGNRGILIKAANAPFPLVDVSKDWWSFLK